MTAGEQTGIPDLRLERFHLGELPPGEMEELRAQLARDAALQARLDAMARSDREVADRYPVVRVADEIRRRVRVAERPVEDRRRVWPRLVPVGALAAILLAVALPFLLTSPSTPDITRIKGDDAPLVVYRRLADGSERLEPGAKVRQGDQVRLAYRAAGRAYGLIVSVDPRGTVTRHLPPEGLLAAALEPNGLVLLDSSYELDGTPGWERFYFIAGSRPFDVEPVVRSAREAASRGTPQSPPALKLGGQLDQFVFTLTKVDR